MNHIYIELEEARKVVAALELAYERGFVCNQAVLRMCGKVSEYGWIEVKYSHMCDKAHPTDGKQNWGCQGVSEYNRVVDGKLEEIIEGEN